MMTNLLIFFVEDVQSRIHNIFSFFNVQHIKFMSINLETYSINFKIY